MPQIARRVRRRKRSPFRASRRRGGSCRACPGCTELTVEGTEGSNPGGSDCRHSWNRRDYRHGSYGPGTPLSRRRISSRPEVMPGAPESSGDRNAGIATWRTRIKQQRCRGSERKRDGAGSRRMGVANHRQRSVFRPMLGLGRTSGYHVRRRISSISWHLRSRSDT
jgi:hypothetical protein